jgi:RNase H-like domain found in reverse transcriptase
VYLVPHKIFAFVKSVELLGFEGSEMGLRPALRHRSKVMDWPTPTCKEEVEAFVWLTPFLRIFIPGRAGHARTLKRSYMTEQQIEGSVRKAWVPKEDFAWGKEQDNSFHVVKECIANNVIAGFDETLSLHLACDASKTGAGGCLFQVPDMLGRS